MNDNAQTLKTWSPGFDMVRVAAAVAVVWLHVAGLFVMRPPFNTGANWWIGNFADSWSRWCVPLFVMLSGALLIPKARGKEPIAFITERLPKILLITVFWTAVYGVLMFRKVTLPDFAMSVLKGVPYFHLWYLYMIIGLYVFAPFLQRAVDALDRRNFAFLLFALFGVSSLAALFRPFYPGPPLFLLMFLPYVGYFCLGHFLVHYQVRMRPLGLVAGAVIAGALIAGAVGVLYPVIGENAWNVMYDYLNPLVVIMSFCVFLLCVQGRYGEGFCRLLARLAPLTLGVYLIHPLAFRLLDRVGLDVAPLGPVIGIPATVVMAILVSGVVTFVIRQIPGFRQVV